MDGAAGVGVSRRSRELAADDDAVEIDGLGTVLFCHATPRNEIDIFTRLTPEERLLPVFAGVDASVVVCGHTHMQFDRMVGRLRVVNAGSVGMPFGTTGADWLLLGTWSRAAEDALRHGRDRRAIPPHGVPDGRGHAVRYILQPPSEEEMLTAWGSRADVVDRQALAVCRRQSRTSVRANPPIDAPEPGAGKSEQRRQQHHDGRRARDLLLSLVERVEESALVNVVDV